MPNDQEDTGPGGVTEDTPVRGKYFKELKQDELFARARRVKAVYRPGGPGTALMFVKPDGPDEGINMDYLRRTAFLWDPEPAGEAKGIKPVRTVQTYHTWAYYGFFKPDIGECLAQIPADLLDVVVAFELVKGPETSDDLNKEKEALNAGYHVAQTTYYVAE
jgi:hypothetical protein